jgi:hypothetical protein
MAGQKLIVGDQVRTIVTFTDADSIVVDAAFSSNIAGGTKYTIAFGTVNMPPHFGGIVGDFSFSTESAKPEVPNVGEANFRRFESTEPEKTGRPEIACIIPKDSLDTNYPDNPSGFQTVFWPAPDAAYILKYKYVAVQGDENESSAATFLGGAQHSETILSSCLAIAEEYAETPSTRYRELFLQRLGASIMLDRRMTSPDNFGANIDRSDNRGSFRKHGGQYSVRYYDIDGQEVGP